MPQDEKVIVALPESLQQQFERLRNRLFRLESLFAAALLISGLLLGMLLVFVSDRWQETPSWMRLLLFGLPVAAALGVAGWWLRRWLFRPRDLEDFAMLVQRKYRRLGDRLLGVVELSQVESRPAYYSPELYRAAIQQVAAESAKYDFALAASDGPARRQVCVAGSLLLVLAGAALILPEAAWNSFQRWVAPLAAIPRFTLVQLAGLPAEQIVPHGEKTTLSGRVEYRSFWKPARVKIALANGQTFRVTAREGQFSLEIPPQVQDGRAMVSVGDAAAAVPLLARHRPAVEQATANIELPEYLGYPVQNESAQAGMIEVLEGSSLQVSLRASRPLSEAWLELPAQQDLALTVTSNLFATPKVRAEKLPEISLRWSDQLGLTNAAPWKLAVQTRRDAAPIPEIEELYRDTAMLETEVLPISLRAQDDFGVKQLGLSWALASADEATNLVSRKDIAHQFEPRDGKYVEETVHFSPAVLGIPAESTLEIRAFAMDFKPDRERTEGPVYRIHVLGTAQHAEMVRQNLESLLVQLEEVTRLEDRIASETRDLKDLQKLDAPETARKIAELEQEQRQNARQLRDMAEEGMKTLREAVRNPAFNEEVLGDWAKNLQQMQQISEKQMQSAANSLKAAAQNPAGREEALAKAQEKEEEALAALSEMQTNVNQGLDELQALTLAQRLRQLGEKEMKIESTLQTNIPDTIGLTPAALEARYQKANLQLAGHQNTTQAESVKIQAEISRFFERTKKPNYGEVSQAMAEARTGDELERIRGLIQENIGMEAMQNLAVWAERFDDWAIQLEPPPDEGGSGSGQGQGESQDDTALKQLLGLLRLREKQLNVQERTRLLHEHLDDQIAYRNGAVLLAASQAKLNRDLSRQAVDNTFPLLELPYNDALTAMTDVENLLDRPRTDETTLSAEGKSLAMLTDLINLLNEEAKRSSSPSSGQSQQESREQMAFLMQMMAPQPVVGMQSGQTGGGNLSGGTTDKAGEATQGDAAGNASEARAIKKGSSVPQNYPTEFREALQNYFKALEQSNGN